MADPKAPTPQEVVEASERALALAPDRVDGQHVLMRAQFLAARSLQQRQQDDAPMLIRVWDRLQRLLPAWPRRIAFRVQAYQVLTRLSNIAFARGDVAQACSYLDALIPILDQQLALQPDNQFFHMLYAIVRSQEAVLEGHRGGAMRPPLLDGLKKLEAVADTSRIVYDYTDTSFNLRYTLVQLPDTSPEEQAVWMRELWRLVDRKRSRLMTDGWYSLNQAALLRWEAVKALREGRPAIDKVERAQALLKPLMRDLLPAPLSFEHSLDDALRILAAHGPGARHPEGTCADSARWIRNQCATDPTPSWLFRPERNLLEACLRDRSTTRK